MATRYTQEQTDSLVSAYANANSETARKAVVTTYASSLGKSTSSIVAKLARERVYVKPAIHSKKAETSTKDAYINHIAIMLNIRDVSRLDSLEKASKAALMLVSDHLNQLNDINEVK
mgnify:CR=1 FL=1|jgi:ABC-type nickel/cobalt efflux system permease component RcnA